MDVVELRKIAGDLDAIKKLMILELIQKGLKQKQISRVLNVSEATLSEMFPKGLLKEVRDAGGRLEHD